MRQWLGGSILLAACAAGTPAWSRDIAGPSVLAEPASTGLALSCSDPCPSFVQADWSLADLQPAGDGAEQGDHILHTRPFAPSAEAPGAIELHLADTQDQPEAAAMPNLEPTPPRPTGLLGMPSPPARWTDHVPREYALKPSFLKQVGTIKTESLILLAYFSAQSGKKLFRETTSFHFNNEHWFGTNTTNLGIDKLTHAFDTYLIAEILHMRLHDKTEASEGDALTAAVLASTFMALNEISDGIETDSGYSMQDITMNLVGAAFSLLRNTVPGMREKVAFKIEIVPNSSIYSYRGQRHYEQQRYMLSLKGSGFKELRKTPLRYLNLQVGYYGSDFMAVDRNAGKEPKRHLFVGVGLDVGEILFGRSHSTAGRVAYTVLDYFQIPYTSLRYDTTGHFGP